MFDFAERWPQGLSYAEFLDRHATPEQRRRWDSVHTAVALTPQQRELLGSFRRRMLIPVLAGAWCGDCINQCPIFDHFAQTTPCIEVRYFDRDEHGDLADVVKICGGRRVPTVIFLSEDAAFCGLLGDRTISKYRGLMADLTGAACPTGLAGFGETLTAVVQDWVCEFERIQYMLRTSPRLRERHGD